MIGYLQGLVDVKLSNLEYCTTITLLSLTGKVSPKMMRFDFDKYGNVIKNADFGGLTVTDLSQ